MTSTKNPFAHFGLEKSILSAISDLGYESATPVQEQGIPILLNGEDLLAQAQTGTGKTATFALPILSSLDFTVRTPQAMIIVPTRELAIQVAEAFQGYAKHVKGFLVAPIYGGQDFGIQLRSIKRGAQVIVGTPGRLMDHLRRKTLPLDALKTVVLDEADEMLKMGFVDDVEWILGQIEHPHQTALFSATLPASIQKIAQRYLKDAKKIQIKANVDAVETIEQCYVTVSNRNQKLDVLTRLLEVEENQAVIIFTRTKNESTELAERLQARGYGAAALNGDMSQAAREKTINRLKKGDLDILIATDVAARGIDVERVTHVINYDIPYDVESYVHRIGRTGRAGRSGKAILFVTPREMRLFNDIERYTKKPIKRIEPPSLKVIREKRVAQLNEKIMAAIREKEKQIAPYIEIVMGLAEKESCTAQDIAAALMFLNEEEVAAPDSFSASSSSEGSRDRNRDRGDRGRGDRGRNDRGDRRDRGGDRRPEGRPEGFARKKFGSSSGSSNRKGAPNDAHKSAGFVRSERPERSERTEKNGNYARPERTEKSASYAPRGERPERSERNDRGDRSASKPAFPKDDKPRRERAWKK